MTEERILVVPSREIAACLPRSGLLQGEQEGLEELICRAGVFLPRTAMESDVSYRQIIPYVVLRRGEEFYAMRRLKKGAEARLRGRLSIGAGGHIQEDDALTGSDVLRRGLERELEEELRLLHPGEPRLLAVINDLSSEVSSVHLGLCYLLETEDAAVRETEKLEGTWLGLGALKERESELENWSRLLLPVLEGEQ